jgi:hypothetical protein
MKTSNRSRVLGALLTGALVLTITTTIPTSAFSITAEQPDVIAPLGTVAAPAVAPTESPPAATYSAGVAEIVKMVDAKVDPQVIKAYIKNSPIPYSPTSSEIIALKEHGVSDDILTTMMQRGAEVRAQGAAAANQAPPAPMAPGGYGYTPVPTYGSDYGSAPYVDYSYGYPYYGYPYYGYPYSYSWYGYPYYYYPFYCGYYGCGNHYYHCHNGHCYGHFGLSIVRSTTALRTRDNRGTRSETLGHIRSRPAVARSGR